MPAPRGLVQHIDQRLHRTMLLPRKARLLVAVSGGADSVALLRLLGQINQSAYWGWTLVVGHVDHGMRGRDSVGDARFVQSLAKQLGLKCVVKRLHLKPASSEDEARRARMKALLQFVRARRCAGVVMAHHADDQAETLLMRMFRGCGLAGLAGISPDTQVNGLRILRPLLDVRRGDMRIYLEMLGQEWREDRTNCSQRYLRNRVRANLMPLLEILWPGTVPALGRLASLSHEAQEIVDAAAGQFMASMAVVRRRHDITLPRKDFQKASPALAAEIMRRLVKQAGGTTEIADFERIGEAVRIARGRAGGKRIEMGLGVTVTVRGGLIGVTRVVRGKKR